MSIPTIYSRRNAADLYRRGDLLMFKTIKKWWKQHLKDVEEYRKEDLQKKYLVIRSYVMRWYEAK